MPATARPLGAADFALLGLVAERPRHGYELAELFGPRGELAEVCPLPRNVLYAMIHRLERSGLVETHVEAVGATPPRRVLSLSADGDAAFRRWLDQPVERMREVRTDFLLKLYFSERTPAHDTARLVAAQIESCRRYLGRRIAERDAATGDFARLLGGVRVASARSTLDWLEQYAADLATRAVTV
jgi:PadR family transcriptional regulator AphA